MKRSIKFLLAAAMLMLFGLATSAPAQMVFHPLATGTPATQTQQIDRAISSRGLTPIVNGVGKIYSPASSVAVSGSAGVSAHTSVEVFVPDGFQPDQVTPPYSGYGFNTPASIACIYGAVTFVLGNGYCNPNDNLANASGGSGTIAIVDAYDDPWIMDDLNMFSSQFGLPLVTSSTFQMVYASGTEPAFDTADDGGWELEESLDVEWAHAMAPSAKIVLVEAADNTLANLLPAVTVASNFVECGASTCPNGGSGKGEVIMSWGTSEFAGEASDDSNFTTANVVYFAAAGDSPGVSWPCSSVNVVCVGGTTYSRFPVGTPSNAGGAFSQYALGGEVQGTWSYGGGGSSSIESLPGYQSPIASTLATLNSSTTTTVPILGYPVGVGISTTLRAVPDVSANANPYTGYWVFDSFQFALLGYVPPASDAPDAGGWWIVGGTSAANNIIAGMANLAGNFRASSAAELTVMYTSLGSFNDVVFGTGQCGPYQGYTANVGWDPCTGIGVPLGLGGL